MSKPYLIDLPVFFDPNGSLVPIEFEAIPFAPVRVFFVSGRNGQVRGHHAHRTCSQFLVAVSGRVEVTTESNAGSKTFDLNDMSRGLFIPPNIWAWQRYIGNYSALAVLCSEPFDEADYIRDYTLFKSLNEVS